ncbi:C4-dicarboxylate ABC transporter substrate-binding protein [Bacillus coahuilensis m2-6]|uniref:C4-dicarboxylate ABC transporter substrate-binding protein n=1 Tax=Bacillus coahuilensis p1.1.43 TaxID=1150625 RepID=A0A147KA57_9BACI|nr:TAXI family TRAP transporter solute-binding subunit [Bacillus coahuilensis]KUP07557.1 C4-dicarboxylate ABC transporter substrate-binding protein [Bacillus coahuilensis p1.1.43]KUP08939.1 C4-dicarboxylate ABC transporter substrate-binding protein [Bacillus coahuilensis m2-6]
MKKKSLMLLTTMLLSFSMILAACGGGSEGGEEVDFIGIATGGTGGTYYPLGGAIAKIIQDETGIKSSAETSGASAENMATLKDGKIEIAFTQTDIASYASEGTQMFTDNKVETAMGIATLYPETIQIVTTKDSGINSVEDLKGKVVSVGEAGSGTRLNAEQILEIHGMSFDDIDTRDLSFDDSTTGIQDGSIDAAFITSGTPTGAVEGLAAVTDVNVVAIDSAKIQELIEKYPYYAEDTIAGGTYSNLEDEIGTVAVRAMLVTREDISEDVIYDITKALFENTDAIAHPKGSLITVETALDGMGITVHPGAKKYFEEQGLTVE